jgi:tetratricopeptide (TPR) repeat protein
MLFGRGLAQELERGKLIESVLCPAAPGQSYALYLPSSFDPAKKWPVLFLFDPGARGPAGVEAFRSAAEAYGWVLAGSNNSRNGPMQENARAARAVWADTLRRLPLDERRVYASGFSGGARVASLLPQLIGRNIAGVIGCGAGLASGLAPGDLRAAAYFGLTGLADFNYVEMKGLDLDLDPSGVPHRFLFFEGRHDWPDPAVCARAVGWMEVMAMKAGLRPDDEALAEAVFGLELEEARSFEDAGRPFWAVERLDAARRLAEGLRDMPELAARIEGLKARKEYGQFLAAEKKRDRREADFQAGFGRAFGAVEGDEAGGGAAVGPVLNEMGIGFLKKEAKNAKTAEDRSLASRLLFEFSFAAQSRGGDLFEKGDLPRAGAYFDLAIEACEPGLFRERYLYYNRACIAARSGQKKRALEFLAAAVDKGFSNLGLLETDKDIDPVRDTDKFREILEKARANGRS